MKRRCSLLVSRDGEPVGEYRFNATAHGLQELKNKIKPEFSYVILSRDGVIHRV